MSDKKSWRDYSEYVDDDSKDGEKTGSQKGHTNGQSSSSWRNYSELASPTTIGNNIINRVNTWLSNHNNYVRNYQSRYAGRKFNYEDSYVKDSKSWLDTVSKQADAFEAERQSILAYMDQYKDYFDEEWMNDIRKTLADNSYTQQQIRKSATQDNDWWSSFGSNADLVKKYGSAEGVYNYFQRDDGYTKKYAGMGVSDLQKSGIDVLKNVVASSGDNTYASEEISWLKSKIEDIQYDELLNLDSAAEQKKIDNSYRYLEDLQRISHWIVTNNVDVDTYVPTTAKEREDIAIYKAALEKYGSLPDVEKAVASNIKDMKDRIKSSEDAKIKYRLGSVNNPNSEYYDSQFEKYSGYAGSTWIDDGWSRFWSFDESAGMNSGYTDIRYDFINDPEGITKSLSTSAASADLHLLSALQPLTQMTEDEVKIYNYHYAKNGKESADEYIDSIYDTLQRRQAGELVTNINSIDNGLLKTIAYGATGLNAGLDQWATGVRQFFTEEDLPTSYLQYANSEMANSLSGFGKYAYQATNVIGNMLPSIMLSKGIGALGAGVKAARTVGAVTMSIGAAGNAYADGLEYGMEPWQARTYGNLVGIAEGALEYVMGGIPAISKADDFLTPKINMIDNALLRIGAKLGWENVKEIAEEELQNYLEPLFRSFFTGEYDAPTFEELLETAIVTAISTPVMGGGDTIINDVQENRGYVNAGKSIMKAKGGMDELMNLSDNVSSISSPELQESISKAKGKATNARRVGMLYDTVSKAHLESTSRLNRADIVKSLTRGNDGFNYTEANRIADALLTRASGQKLSSEQSTLLESVKDNAKVNSAIKDIINNSKSTVANRSNMVTNFAEDIGIANKIGSNVKVAGVFRSALEQESSAQYKSLTERSGSEGRFGVSESGKAVIRSTGEEIDIKSLNVATVGDGQMTFKVGDKKVSAGDIDFADANQSFLVSAVSNIENITPAAANAIMDLVDTSKPLGLQLNAVDEAYTYGYYNYSKEDLMAGQFAKNLTSEQLMSAYQLGQSARKISDTTKVENFKKMRTAADAIAEKNKSADAKNLTITYNHGNGKVVSIEEAGITDAKQSGAVEVAKILHKLGLGTRVEFFSSYLSDTMTVTDKKTGETKKARVFLDDNGVEQMAYSGVYRQKDGTIRVDLNAYNGRGLTLNALAHELTHFIQQWSDTKYNVLVDFLMENYEKTDMTMHERVLREQKRLEDIRGESVSYDEAYDEVVANAMMKMFDDGKLVEKLTELKQKDKNLAQKLWEGFKKILAKFLGIYEKEGALFKDTADLMAMKETFEQLQNMFAEALVEASENYQASLTPGVEGTTFNAKGEAVAHSTKDGTIQLSMHTYETEGRDAFRSYLEKCVSSKKLTKDEMTEMLNGIEDIYQTCKEFKDKYAPFSTWSDAAVVRDTHGRPVFSVVTPNGDYKMNLDFSLVCKKRRTLDAVFNEMSKRGIIDDFELGQKSVVKINEIIRKYGFETACALCFVDAKRFRQASMADSFTRLYNELVESLVPEDKKSSISYFNFSGYETIKDVENGIDTWDNSKLDFSHINHVLKTYESGTVEYKTAKYIKSHAEGRKLLLRGDFMSSNGFDAVKSKNPDVLKLYNSKKGTGGPKAAFGDVQYMNEIIKKARWWTPAKAYSVGGVRVQSFSDYVPRMVFDYVQMIYDLAATKLPAHAYTKEALFVKQFGLTGIKINMSLIPAIAKNGIAPGLDANGNYVWAGESFDYETAKNIQNAEGYTENCGTICVGVSYDHIVKLLRDPNIRMVIPYHKSGLNPIVAHMNKIAEFHDYTNDQRTKGKDGKALEKDFDFSKAMHDMGENGNPKAVADQYLKWCAANGYTPRFAEFAMEDNYYKLLEDFTLYDKDGNYVPQRQVRAVFPTESSAFGSMKSLIKEGLQEDAVIEGKRDKMLPEIVDEIQKSLPKTEAEIDETQQVEQADRDLEAGERFSLHDPFEETKDLLAYHNLSAEQLLEAIANGGLVMPSTSVTNKANVDFGAISAVFDKSTIDPKANADNKLYGADAWTPNVASLKPNAKFDTDKTVNAVNSIKSRIGSKIAAELFNVTPKQFKEAIIAKTGSIYDAYANNLGVKAAYALEKGLISEIPTKNGKVDTKALRDLLEPAMADLGWRQYKSWLHGISDEIIKSYDKPTRDDILKSMKAQPATAKPFKLSVDGNLTVPAVEYSSIDEARRNKHRLSENAEEATKAVASEFLSLAKQIGGNTTAVVDAINAAFANRYSTGDIVKTFDSMGIDISTETASDLQALYKKSVELPTQYFEAKPGRSVGLDEIKAVIMPDSSDMTEVKAKLEELGVSVVEYKDGSKESRVEALNSLDDLKFSSQETDADTEVFKDYDIVSAVYTIRNEKAKRGHDLVEIGSMPTLYRELFGLSGDVYVSNEHLYQNMVSRATAEAEGRFDPDASADYHELGEEKVINAIEQFQYPLVIMESLKDFNEPRLVAILEEKGNDGQNLIAVMELYAPIAYPGKHQRRNHVLITIYEKTSLPDYIEKTGDKDRILHIKEGLQQTRQADLQLVGAVSKETLAKNVARFNKKVKAFKEKNNIQYSSQETDIDTSGMDENAKEIIHNLQIRAMGSRYLKGEYASYSAERIVRELNNSSATKMDYAKSYIAWVEPLDFLYATTISQENRDQIEKEAGELDLERLRKQTQPIHLTVDFETGKIVGHEGRHRMIALYKAGVKKVAVIFDAWNDNRHNTKPVSIKKIGGQEFDRYHGGIDFYVHDMLPLSKRYAEAATKLFSDVAGSVRYSGHETDYSNRSLLANAFEGLSQNSEEYKMIQEYKGRIKLLNEQEEKLAKLNAEIREIRFTKGKYDAKKLRQLEAEARNVAKEINTQDKKLLDMEVSEPFRKVIAQERKKEAQKTREHINEILQNKKTRAEQTELRHKIRKAVRDLDKLLNRGNKKTNVKEDMKDFVSKALEIADYLFTDHISNDELIRRGITVRMTPKEAALVKETEDIIAKLDAATDINQPGSKLTDEEFTRLDAKRKANEDKLRDLLTAQRNERLQTPVYQLFDDLVKAYASLKNSSQDSVKAAYNEELEKSLRAFMSDDSRVKILENMRVADMTTEELNWLYRAYTMVLTNVRNANKFHVQGMNETIDQKVGRIMSDFGSRKIPEGKVAVVARNIFNKIGWNYEKLHYALDRIGSEAFTELIMNLANSENIVMADVIEAAAFRDEIVEKYGFNNWDVNKQIDKEFLDNTGKKFKLTLGELMSLYAYSRREGAWDHIEYGGFVFGKNDVTNPKPADTYKLSKEQCEAITNTLTKEQKGYVEEMQKFLSETMGAKGNEVSMMLYGIKMFGEKNYFPIHIAGQFKAQAQESQAKAAAGFGTMSNAGFTHAQNPNAKAPFVLEGFNEVWVDHVNEMSRYHGTVPALEDIRRVMNRSSYSDTYNESMSVKAVMENAFGKDAVSYFDNLYREANSGAITDKLQEKSHRLLSLFRKNSVAYSLSVLIQQPASLVRAYAMIPKKYFGVKGFGTITSGVVKAVADKWTNAHTNAYNEMLKYAPGVTLAKEIGGFDTHTGGSIRSYLLDTDKSFSQKWKTGTVQEKGKAVMDIVDDNAIANLPNLADKIAWIEIWNACKRETVATHKDLVPNSDEFMQVVGDRFTEVIRATQVYDSMFSKSPMLKSKNLAVQYLVSFMNEPNTVANMVEKSVRDATKGDWKSGLKTAGVVIHSIIFTNLLKSLIYAMRDDDEDETYTEKYIEAVAGNMMDDFNALNYIPLVRDAWSLAQGYDVERADMAIVADALDAVNRVVKNATTDTEDMTEEQLVEFDKKVTEANWKLVESLASFFGIPVKNIRREINGVLNHARIAKANAGNTTPQSAWEKFSDAIIDSIPFMQNNRAKDDKLYEAILSGDTDYVNRLKAGYKDDDSFNSAVRKLLRENDPRIHEAAMAYYSGNLAEYKRIFKQIQNDDKKNIIGFDNIMEAVMSEVSAIKGELEPKTESSAYNTTDFVNAVLVGDTNLAQTMKEDIISYKVAHGATQAEAEESFTDSVATNTRDKFDSGLLDEAGTEKMLLEYAGMDEEEAADKVGYWSFIKAHPKYRKDLSQTSVEKYHEFAEPAEIPLDVFVQYLKGTRGINSIKDEWGDEVKSVREQVLEVIDSLPLTWQQKDALYLAHGYAESKIWDVPW